MYLAYLCTIVPECSSVITCAFVINSVIVVAINNIISEIYLNSNETSGSTSGGNGGILLKICNFQWSYTSHTNANVVVIRK
jgi:hypothetical protein